MSTTFKPVILKGDIHIKKDGTTNLKIRITHNRKAEYISTSIFVVPDKSKRGYSMGGNSKFITDEVSIDILKYQKAYRELGDMADKMSAKELKAFITADKNEDIDFIAFAESYLKQLKIDGKDGSLRAARGLISALKKYSPKLFFAQIDSKFLANFERNLVKEGMGNGVQSYMSRFRVIFNKGREFYNDDDRGIMKIKNYPFKKYKIIQPKTDAKNYCLNVEQLRMLINYKPVTPREILGKDMFLLMFYMIGPNTKDLFYFNKADKSGRILYDRFKTGRNYSVKMQPEAREIIEKYKGKLTLINASVNYGNYLDFQKSINKGLKRICENIQKQNEKIENENERLDFPLKITSNWARHTWATIGRNDCRIAKDDVALCLGHEDSDNKVTDMYIRYDYSIEDECNRKVIDMVIRKEEEKTESQE